MSDTMNTEHESNNFKSKALKTKPSLMCLTLN